MVVLFEATGLNPREIGEIRASPNLKARGYFFDAAADVVTAAVALLNGFGLVAAR